jgi:hypothetical protein
MSMDNEIHTLLGIVLEGFKAAEQRFDSTVEPAIKAELHLAQSAAEQAMHALGALVLSDIKRIADSLEILAKAELGRAALFTKGPTS